MPLSLFSFLLLTLSTFPTTSQALSNAESFIFKGCSQLKFTPGSTYENNVNSLLSNLISAAMFNNFYNFTVPGAAQQDTVYGLFQCRGDLNGGACSACVSRAVSQLGTLCVGSCSAALQLDGCFVKYDNTSFLGMEDKTLVMSNCGPSANLTYDALTDRDAVLAYLGTSDGIDNTYRVSSFGNVQGLAQCLGDLSPSMCQDCLLDAIERLKTDCRAARWAQIYLAKCYALYFEGGNYSPHEESK